jgi:Zn-dependent protease
MFRAIKVGRVFGIEIRVHWTFLLLPLYVMYMNREHGRIPMLLAAGLTLSIFFCVLLHEYGHALTARAFGVQTRDIILTPIGGIARLERMPESPIQEIIVALAGPAVNVVIAFVILMSVLVSGLPLRLPTTPAIKTGSEFVFSLLAGNIMLVVFNMVPAFPMDGGRVLRALLAIGMGRLRATEIATTVGLFVAGLFFLLGVFVSPMLAIIGIAIALLGQMERLVVRMQYEQRRRRATAEQDIETVWETDDKVEPPEPNFTGFTWDPSIEAWVHWRDGKPERLFR